MTDEEKAEEYLRKGVCQGCSSICEGDCAYAKPVKQAYLDGLAASRKDKLHDLLENPNDLPDTNREVLVLLWDYDNYHIGRYEEEYDDIIRENTYWHFDDFSIEKDKLDTVLGWFELPKINRR